MLASVCLTEGQNYIKLHLLPLIVLQVVCWCRAREAAAHDKAAASEAEMREEELQATAAKLQKQLDKV